ncbi:MAG: preprotein translocase subunit SecA [Candidatus Moraniibacteriota bacterium]|nr:MAG: preprotein translocase subunit SecA [Candidatus Moranbacteria bacterium]
MGLFSKIFGSNDRVLAKLRPIVDRVNTYESKIAELSDDALRAKTEEFRERLAKGISLDRLLPEAFAVVREAAKRIIGERHYDVQIMGGIVLHQGKIAEMKTGEGKTLTSTLAIYLNALAGKGVHVVTVNDYLAKRDANWMGSVYHALGLSTACILQQGISYRYTPTVIDRDEVSVEPENLIPISRREAYAADITYGTNNEFGFDYLRDNMVQSADQMVQRELFYAIVDEVDSILIDEARTPLIISAPDSESTRLYQQFASIVPRLKDEEDYTVDEKMKSISITEAGIAKVEQSLGIGNIYESGRVQYVHHLEQSLKAEVIFKRDRDYVVKDGEVIIVDDFTGRLMVGRRYSDGLHQAIEAKEHVAVQKESRTLATITFQNYFRLYDKLAGMTGTAMTSAEEFRKVYEIDSIEIPTNKTTIRQDFSDIVYKTEEEKFRAIVNKLKILREKGQPALVGTIAIEKSEYLSAMLSREGVPHEVLNAKNHEREASIVARAGQLGSVTIATNMAGRGTDIKLGEGVREVGGLCIIGTERHEARRIDNQLRGRAGRQGDPGTSQFYVSLEDELMRRFGGDTLKNMMTKLRLPEDEPIQNGLISRTIESAQNKIEGFNFDIRKHVLEYDDVMNKQREVIYRRRRTVLHTSDMRHETFRLLGEELEKILVAHAVSEDGGWDKQSILNDTKNLFPVDDKKMHNRFDSLLRDTSKERPAKISAAIETLLGEAKVEYGKKEQEINGDAWLHVQRAIFLRTLDALWMNHLDEIDYLRQGIGLRGYGQRDPLVEYKREAFNMFVVLLESIRTTYLSTIFKMVAVPAEQQAEVVPQNAEYRGAEESPSFPTLEGERPTSSRAIQKPLATGPKVGRNDPCPCGSRKKYKKCHGK